MMKATTDQHWPSVMLEILDAKNLPAKVDGIPIWASSDETVVIAVPSPDGMSGAVETVAPGTARITFTADADLGTGVSTITLVSDDLEITQGIMPATMFKATFGEPVAKV